MGLRTNTGVVRVTAVRVARMRAACFKGVDVLSRILRAVHGHTLYLPCSCTSSNIYWLVVCFDWPEVSEKSVLVEDTEIQYIEEALLNEILEAPTPNTTIPHRVHHTITPTHARKRKHIERRIGPSYPFVLSSTLPVPRYLLIVYLP